MPTFHHPTTAGRCGAAAPLLRTTATARLLLQPADFCALDHGHDGWHESDNGTEWNRPTIHEEIEAERRRAHEKHGQHSMEAWPADNLRRLSILLEEVGEVAREFNEAEIHGRRIDAAHLRTELIQVAAMAAGWADAIGRPS